MGTAVGLAPIVLFFIVRNSVVRFLFVVVGGLLVLGSSGDLSANKIVYAGLLVLCAAVSVGRLIASPPSYARHFKSLIWVGLALLAIVSLSYLASPAGSDLGTFGRQAIFYLLIVLGPVIGLDAGRDIPRASRTPSWASSASWRRSGSPSTGWRGAASPRSRPDGSSSPASCCRRSRSRWPSSWCSTRRSAWPASSGWCRSSASPSRCWSPARAPTSSSSRRSSPSWASSGACACRRGRCSASS
ncbi:hypothetical protein [Clavibacter tessellarius]|uniref:hypothetical protein n=1 Tax=Clavibacter tessellarius TaxID=31965 RepID=UPI00324613C5